MTTTVHWLSVPVEIDRERLNRVALQSGLTPTDEDTSDLLVDIQWSTEPDLTYDSLHRRPTDEAYRLDLGVTPSEHVTITVTGPRSLRWALVDLREKITDPSWVEGRIRCSPSFVTRGLIEGFYGPPWTHEARLDMVDFAARNRLNTVMYAPKDDPYLRRDWRVPHAEASRDRLAEMIGRCRDLDIDAMVGISPGLSMRYSSDEDADLLDAKIATLVEVGATSIALLYDDIPDRLQHPGDIEAFPDLAAAQCEVANRVHDKLRVAGIPLVVCPTIYWGEGDETYISALGQGLDPRIDMFWTGRAICSPAITASEAAHFARVNNRPPLYWDNYPVNDVAMTAEMHIGAYQNRDPLLARFSNGVMANAMEYPEASKIALATISDYLWDADGYDAEISWVRAITQVAGAQDAAAMLAFADTVRASCLSDPEPVALTEALQAFAFEVEYGDPDVAGEKLEAFAEEIRRAAAKLQAPDVENRTLQAELVPWLTKYELGAEAVSALATHACSDSSMTPEGVAAISHVLERLKEDDHRVFGDVLEMTLADTIL
ncbi:MAG: protein O-GlcNAcase [Actinomycetia bacterium]|nr:protein O-GlcNAcase [Actinomycetes bacterium]